MLETFISMVKSGFQYIYSDDNGYDLIVPYLYLGNCDSINKENLLNLDIQLVINATTSCPFQLESSNIRNIRIPIEDDLSMSSNIKMYTYIKLVLPIIDSYVKNKKPVFINCMAGMQRSATIVAAYLIVYRGYNVEEAISFIRKRRPIAFRPGPNFLHALNMIYMSIENA